MTADERSPNLEIIDLDGPLHYADYGGGGPLMVLVHGLGGSHLNWLHIAPALARSYHVLAPDLAGFGLTPPAGRKSTVRANQRLVDAFITAHAGGEPAVLVGNSMGGLISMLQAAANPSRVDALVLIDPALPLADTGSVNVFTVQRLFAPLIPGVGEAALGRYYSRVSPERQLEETLAAVTADPGSVPTYGRESNLEMIRLRKQMEWAVPSFLQASRSIAGVLARRRRFKHLLAAVRCPVLLIHGEEDTIVSPASARWAHRHRPDWRIEILAGIGHVPQLESPARVVELIDDFLASP